MISVNLRKQIYELMKATIFAKLRFNNYDYLNVLSSIWNIYDIDSTGEDPRYSKLGDEIVKHYFMNDDWIDDKLYISVLHLLDNEDRYLRFLEDILNILYISGDYVDFKLKLLPLLNTENIYISEVDNNGKIKIIIKIKDTRIDNAPESQSLKFYVCKSTVKSPFSFSETDIKWPNDQTCFVLTFNYSWNDYSYRTRYNLYYVNNGSTSLIGEVKIMKLACEDTSTVLPSSFYSLGSDFCSLGQSEEYYRKMSDKLGNSVYVYLNKLCDAALYSHIQRDFEKSSVFVSSLIRSNESERALRLGRFIIYGRDVSSAFSFVYNYKPPYQTDDAHNVQFAFDFSSKKESFKRAIALIGENGVGKSSLMKDIIKNILNSSTEKFDGLTPLFSCVMAITYSPFDDYPLNGTFDNSIMEYVYCGLLGEIKSANNDETNIEQKRLLTIDEQANIFFKNVKFIEERNDHIFEFWINIMSEVISPDILNGAIYKKACDCSQKRKIDEKRLKELFKNASSGESIYLSITSSILSKIRYDSILFLDEPEQHLHPAGITVLVSSIMKILKEYNSFAIISTHSPFIIREIPSSNVRIMHRKNNRLYNSPIGIESFGEDVSVISDIVFEDLNKEKRFLKVINSLASDHNFDFNAIVSALQDNKKPLGLNTKLLISSVLRNHNAK